MFNDDHEAGLLSGLAAIMLVITLTAMAFVSFDIPQHAPLRAMSIDVSVPELPAPVLPPISQPSYQRG